jgi:hypothetical protein
MEGDDVHRPAAGGYTAGRGFNFQLTSQRKQAFGGNLTRRVDRPFGVLPCTGAAFRPFDRFESDRAGGM